MSLTAGRRKRGQPLTCWVQVHMMPCPSQNSKGPWGIWRLPGIIADGRTGGHATMRKAARLPVNSSSDFRHTSFSPAPRRPPQSKPRRAGPAGCEVASAPVGKQCGRGGTCVLELPWKAATWLDATLTQLSNDSSVRRVQACEDGTQP